MIHMPTHRRRGRIFAHTSKPTLSSSVARGPWPVPCKQDSRCLLPGGGQALKTSGETAPPKKLAFLLRSQPEQDFEAKCGKKRKKTSSKFRSTSKCRSCARLVYDDGKTNKKSNNLKHQVTSCCVFRRAVPCRAPLPCLSSRLVASRLLLCVP